MQGIPNLNPDCDNKVVFQIEYTDNWEPNIK